jgi:hypothetical protein
VALDSEMRATVQQNSCDTSRLHNRGQGPLGNRALRARTHDAGTSTPNARAFMTFWSNSFKIRPTVWWLGRSNRGATARKTARTSSDSRNRKGRRPFTVNPKVITCPGGWESCPHPAASRGRPPGGAEEAGGAPARWRKWQSTLRGCGGRLSADGCPEEHAGGKWWPHLRHGRLNLRGVLRRQHGLAAHGGKDDPVGSLRVMREIPPRGPRNEGKCDPAGCGRGAGRERLRGRGARPSAHPPRSQAALSDEGQELRARLI